MTSLDLPLNLTSFAQQFDNGTYQRGLSVLKNRQVLEYTLDQKDGQKWRIDGKVKGTQRSPYRTQVELLLDDAGKVLEFDGTCSCPVGYECKHTVALTLTAAQGAASKIPSVPSKTGAAKSKTAVQPSRSINTSAERDSRLEQARHLIAGIEAENGVLSHFIAQQPERSAEQAVNTWLNQFESPAGSAPTKPASADRVVFLLSAYGSRPRLSWGLAHPMVRGGGWTKVKQAYHVPPSESNDVRECIVLIRALGIGPEGYGYGGSLEGVVQGRTGLLALQLAADSGRLLLKTKDERIEGEPLRWGEARTLTWDWTQQKQRSQARPGQTLTANASKSSIDPQWQLTASLDQGQIMPGGWYLDVAAGQCGLLHTPGISAHNLNLLLQAPPMAQSTIESQGAQLLPKLAGLPLPPGVQPVQAMDGIQPTAHLLISQIPEAQRADLGLLSAALSFDYAGLRHFWPDSTEHVLHEHEGRRVLLQRDLPTELKARAALMELGLLGDQQGLHYVPPASHSGLSPWLAWLDDDFAALRSAGFFITQDDSLNGFIEHAGPLEVRLSAAGGHELPGTGAAGEMPDGENLSSTHPWFELSLGIEIEGVRQNVLPWLPDLLAQLQTTASGAQLPPWVWRQRDDGGFVRIATAPLKPWLQALLDLLSEHNANGEHLRLSRLETLRLGASLGEGVAWAGAAQLRSMLAQLAGREQLPQAPLPLGLQAQLRPYQHQGLSWLQFLRAQGLAGILADDMGLGKTLQTLAHIQSEKEAGRLDRPALVIAPVSLLGNWQREAARFTPALKSLVWHGTGRFAGDETPAQRLAASDLVIAPYSLLQRDRELWQNQAWHLVVLDEAQNIKNASTQAAQVASGLNTRHRLCLSGTPLENHLGELWSLFHFLMPGFLGSQARFGKNFRVPIEKMGDSERLEQLRRRITPFMLRRSKAAVATELPEKVENITTVALSGPQADVYETIRLATEESVRKALADKGLARSQILILEALLKLRQVCCDPRLVSSLPAAQKVRHSAKLEQLLVMLPEMLAEGRRVLVFSQFTSMLTLIEEGLKQRGLSWTKLTGQTQQRDKAIERFTSGEVPLFLISLKAGGTGLNLPQADTVIHYDPWWNPAVEDQATGRAHRIGQKNKVFV